MNGKVPNSVSKLPMPDVKESKEPPPDFCMKHDNPVPFIDGSCMVCAEEPKEKEKPMLELEMLVELVKHNSCIITGIIADIKNLVEFNTTLFKHIEKLEERLINAIKDGPKRYYSRRGVDIDANRH